MKKKLFTTALCLAAGALAVFLLRPKPTRAITPAPDAQAATTAKPAREGTPVRTVILKGQTLDESIVATGTVRADESIDVQAEVSGKLLRIHFREGALVHAGDLLAVINDAELRASLQRAVYRRELAGVKARRVSALVDKGGMTQQEWDIAASELNVLEAEVTLIEAQLARTEIRAPFDGIIGLRNVSEGAFITPTTKIATFQRLDRLKVDFSIPEKYAYRLSPDSEVTIAFAGSNPALTGRIHAIEPLVNAATRTVQIRAVCGNPSGRSFSGGFVSVRLRLAQISDAILVPALAIVPGANEQSVFIVENGLAKRRVVRTGTRTDSAVQVVEGLSSGDMVIVSGLQLVRTGQPVKTLHDDAPPPTGGMITKLEHQTAATALN